METLESISGSMYGLFGTKYKVPQYHDPEFRKMLDPLEKLNVTVPEMKIDTHLTIDHKGYISIIVSLGGVEKVVYKNKISALRVLISTMRVELRDGRNNNVFYLDEFNQICRMHCSWNRVDPRPSWYCYVSKVKPKDSPNQFDRFYYPCETET